MKNMILFLCFLQASCVAYPAYASQSINVEYGEVTTYQKPVSAIEGKQRQIDKLMRENAALRKQVEKLRKGCGK